MVDHSIFEKNVRKYLFNNVYVLWPMDTVLLLNFAAQVLVFCVVKVHGS